MNFVEQYLIFSLIIEKKKILSSSMCWKYILIKILNNMPILPGFLQRLRCAILGLRKPILELWRVLIPVYLKVKISVKKYKIVISPKFIKLATWIVEVKS